ncbi:MAG TPA: hypothetical protein VJV74_05430, partial [Terriglobia bacterium]|nr:hypothetical protein [Terriglobia bacterium]
MLRCAKFVASWGATIEEIADGIGVDRSTVYDWMENDPEFSDAVNQARDLSDAEVVRSLRRRAMGYDHNGQHIPAHPTAQIFWLKNRLPKEWRDRTEVEHSVNLDASDPNKIADALVARAHQFPAQAALIRAWAE